jgi:hypothetical protein
MKAKTKLEKNKITYEHFMIPSTGGAGGEYANPGKERIEKALEMIMNSNVTIIEEFEYSYHPIEEDLSERKKATKEDRNGKQEGITLMYSNKGIFKLGRKKINYAKTVFTGHRKITFYIQQRYREGRAIIEPLNNDEQKKFDHRILDNMMKNREKEKRKKK